MRIFKNKWTINSVYFSLKALLLGTSTNPFYGCFFILGILPTVQEKRSER